MSGKNLLCILQDLRINELLADDIGLENDATQSQLGFLHCFYEERSPAVNSGTDAVQARWALLLPGNNLSKGDTFMTDSQLFLEHI